MNVGLLIVPKNKTITINIKRKAHQNFLKLQISSNKAKVYKP